MQIAFDNVAYLIDVPKTNSSALLNQKLTALFLNPDIIKLGINFKGDIEMMKKSYPHLTAFGEEFVNLVDLLDVYTELFKENSGGLAGLCEIILNQSLCKGEQMSNWERRPLRLSQMHYAALDSHVLLSIYRELTQYGSASKKNERVGKGCDNCGSKLHDNPRCKRGKRCQICQLFGHITKTCPYN